MSPHEPNMLPAGPGMTPLRRFGVVLALVVLLLAWNRGISYGLFQQGTDLGRWFLVVIPFVAAIWLWRWMMR